MLLGVVLKENLGDRLSRSQLQHGVCHNPTLNPNRGLRLQSWHRPRIHSTLKLEPNRRSPLYGAILALLVRHGDYNPLPPTLTLTTITLFRRLHTTRFLTPWTIFETTEGT